ncbi:MAG: FGGY family carbohydrate kinase [Actinomycetota bacterium]|nr:FGGY family carbohydrate kinase [Actinomycetota bacterium]
MAHVLGIDVGTSATRATLLDDDGSVVATASGPYSSTRGTHGECEQDPEDWLLALEHALAGLPLATAPPSAVGLCGQTPTLVLVGEDGRPVRPAMTWQDVRAREEAGELAERLGPAGPLVGTDLPWSPANMPAKLLWLSRHEPTNLARTRWLLQAKDVVVLALTGAATSDAWSSKGICRVDTGGPATEVLEACGWSSRACPPIGLAWDRAGEVRDDAAGRFGIASGTPVSVGWSDALAQVLAAGCYERSSAFFFSGTSAIVGAPVADERSPVPGLFSVPRSCSPSALLYGPTQSSGAALAWVADLLGLDPGGLADLALGAAGEPPAFVPYLSGERAPWWDEGLRAAFLGVGSEHGRPELARSVLEGVFFSARHLLSLVAGPSGERAPRVEVVGRGVGDRAWEMLAAGALGATLAFHGDPDLSARGAAMLGAAAAGEALSSVGGRLGAPVRTVVPREDDVARGDAAFARYLDAVEVSRGWRSRPAARTGRVERGTGP